MKNQGLIVHYAIKSFLKVLKEKYKFGGEVIWSVPIVIKKQDDLELSKGFDGIPHCEAYHYSSCKKIVIDYGNK